ncbi:hypothetical protein KXX33_004429 [Aspergillus fumigatus]|nr:hypothetical protein KXX45_007614 [Aspergillus fumigatus]KAH1292170.1 hypothetical protein KXX48_006632 [Aspergillus fumigatus]KAH1310539.1 hypothetical protein KXX66_008969 [Aspergillus fumigatus]KAH1342120.1 hypothetical protein KXX67_006743 [Aspergillus fumigatus]KAH1361553.1 hypothetical protein KXX33_004429 [Aspergillus fumigatus]
MRLLSLTLLLSAAVALPSAEKSCSGVGFPCGNATVNAYDCCVPLVCAPGALATCLPAASYSSASVSQKQELKKDNCRDVGSNSSVQSLLEGGYSIPCEAVEINR